MGTTKLKLFNGALKELGQRRLSDTGEAIQSARELVSVYDETVAECLEAGSWNFAIETIKAAADTGITPEFGYTEVFAKPSDWIKTIAVSDDEYFSLPMLNFYDDASFWSADSTPIYVRYVSNDTGLGLELNRWPARFTRYVQLELADRVCMILTQNGTLKDAIAKERDKKKKEALNFDAMNESQPKFPPPGSWVQSRGGRIGRGDRGSRNSFTG